MHFLLSKLRAPSPALVIAVISLIVAVGGGYAIAKKHQSPKKVANNVVTKRAPGLSVLHAKTADNATSANTAGSANPAAFAQVAANGTINAANSNGVTQANLINTGPIIGYYCFGNLPFVPHGGNATVDWNGGPIDTIALVGLGGNGSCPAGTQLFVDTRWTDSTGSIPAGFFITLYH
jgi:hypothetical protein